MEKGFIKLPNLQKQPTLVNESRPKSPTQVFPKRSSTLMTIFPRIDRKLTLKLPTLEDRRLAGLVFAPKVSKKQHGKVSVFAGCTSPGMREINEDRVVMYKKVSKISGKTISYFAIFDGFSGKFVASFLRDNLHKAILAHPEIEDNTGKAIQEGFAKVQSDLLYQHKSKVQKTGSCALVCLVIGKFVYIANLGNGRCFMSSLKGFEKDLITEDHVPKNPNELERILRENGEIIEFQGVLRVKPAMLNVTRCFGCESAEGSGVTAVPDVKLSKISKNMDFLLMASDGIWEVLSKQEIINSLWTTLDRSKGTIQEKVSKSVEELMKKAMASGSQDNLSVIFKHELSDLCENHLSASTDCSTLCNEINDLCIETHNQLIEAHDQCKKRERKNSQQVKLLIEEFDKNQHWDRKIIQEIAEKLDMKFAQIYKWHWEWMKKVKKKRKTCCLVDLTCKESLMPLAMEKELFLFQKQYRFQFTSRS